MKLPMKMRLYCKRHHQFLSYNKEKDSYGCPEPTCTDIEVDTS